MHHQTRQALCRLGFLLFCLLPTGVVAVWAIWPSSKSRLEGTLSNQLGLRVTCQEVTHPRPGVSLLSGLQLSDPEAGTVAKVSSLEVTRNEQGTFVTASHPEIVLDQLGRIHELLHERVLRHWNATRAPAIIRASQVKLLSQDDSSELSEIKNLLCKVTKTNDGARVSVSFQTTTQPLDQHVEFAVQRINRKPSDLATRWFLRTNGTPLPCALIATHVPRLQRLGGNCQFSGLVWAERSARGWSGDISGQFSGVDLDRLVSDQFPHRLSGIAEIKLDRAKLEDGRLSSAAGSLQSRNGVIGQSLLAAAAYHLNLRQVATEDTPTIRYGQLDLNFKIDGHSLTLRGNTQGTVLQGESSQPLLAESPGALTSVLALVWTLVPSSSVQVPLTKETALLLSLFPLPTAR